jgi:hypothetical protein
MKQFHCTCGNRIFFENRWCSSCNRSLGFDPVSRKMLPLDVSGQGFESGGRAFRLCRNRQEHDACNWLIPADAGEEFCLPCSLNEVIPHLGSERNLQRWRLLEQAKARLLYSLTGLGLPLRFENDHPALRFRFLEDQRTNPLVEESFVATGHYAGVITINVAEADAVARHEMREQMQERYRTLLGHFRHESGHFYFDWLMAQDASRLEAYRRLFGDERLDYVEAIENYYANFDSFTDWRHEYVSQYARSHPLEDWAETWSHYLLILDALETAAEDGLVPAKRSAIESDDWMTQWSSIAVTLNEMNRSLGQDDAYPFVITTAVAEKLRFVRRLI